jgi:hypothetical protein
MRFIITPDVIHFIYGGLPLLLLLLQLPQLLLGSCTNQN